MKKVYIAPSVEVLNLQVENLIASSPLDVYDNETAKGGSALSNKKGWNSEDWSTPADEE